MSKNICVISAKGGVGKTVVTLNLSAALMELNRNVIAVDADIKMSGLALQLGMYHFPVTINDILRGRQDILEALYIHSSGLRVIPASLSIKDTSLFNLKNVLSNPVFQDKIVLVDSPPGLERNALAVTKSCKECIVITTPEIPSIADVMKSIESAAKNKCDVLGVILNRYRKGYKHQITPKEVESICGLPILGIIPEDKLITKSIFRRIPSFFLNPHSKSSIEFKKIAAKIVGEEYIPENAIRRLIRRIRI